MSIGKDEHFKKRKRWYSIPGTQEYIPPDSELGDKVSEFEKVGDSKYLRVKEKRRYWGKLPRRPDLVEFIFILFVFIVVVVLKTHLF